MNSNYPRRTLSPIQMVKSKTDFRANKKHPVREEIDKSIGTFNLTATVAEDAQTLAEMNIEGLVAFICTLKKDGRIIAQGRGSTVINPANRYISRAVHSAFNSSLSDAVIRATKVLDTVHPNPSASTAEYSKAKDADVFEPATDKQRHYLAELIALNVQDENERERRQSQLGELTKQEASRLIESFRR